MANWKKLASGAAGAAGGDVLHVDDVFSVDVYTGNGSTTTITNGLDLSTEGGLIWIKARTNPGGSYTEHNLIDTERGNTSVLYSNRNYYANQQGAERVYQINTDGFAVDTYGYLNVNNQKYCAWSFRKCPNFFDAVQYSGNNENAQYVSHNLGVTPSVIILKSVTSSGRWYVWHKDLSSTSNAVRLDQTSTPSVDTNYEIGINASASSIYIDTGSEINYGGSSDKYIAYLFAHHNNDGGFGENGDRDIIKCGSFSGGYENKITLGFRPQWVMIKRINGSGGGWYIFDKMRGWHANPTYQSKTLTANTNNQESSQLLFWPTADGFVFDDISTEVNYPSGSYIYIAISDETRPAEDATDCFDINLFSGTGSNNELQAGTGWDADMVWVKPRTNSGYGNAYWARHHGGDLSVGNYLSFNASSGFTQNANSAFSFTERNGHYTHGADTYGFHNYSGNYIDYVFKNTEGFFDSGVYLGPATASGSVAHRLGVKPELIYIKNNESSYDEVLGLQFGSSSYKESLYPMDYAYSSTSYSTTTNFGAEPDADNFYVNDNNKTGASSQRYSYQAFATLAGISKLGTYTGTGSTQTINCAFSNGARFVMIKDLGGNSHWYMFTSDQGISSSSNDPYLLWGNSDSEVTNTNFLNAASSGFALNGSNTLNTNGSTYFFVAIA